MVEPIDIREYQDSRGRSPFAAWFDRMDPAAAAKVVTAVTRLAQGNLGSLKGVGTGVQEMRINFGPGYRVYLGRDGEKLVLLLGGGTKARQQRDIEAAIERWRDYKDRKRRAN